MVYSSQMASRAPQRAAATSPWKRKTSKCTNRRSLRSSNNRLRLLTMGPLMTTGRFMTQVLLLLRSRLREIAERGWVSTGFTLRGFYPRPRSLLTAPS